MTSTKPQARFSRRTLNIIIFATLFLIVLFFNMPGAKRSGDSEADTNRVTPLSSADSAALFTDTTPRSLVAPGLISALPTPSHRIAIQSWQTRQGAQVLFVESREVPMLDMRLVFNAGAARDGDLGGVALLTNAMLNEGTKNFSVDDIARRFESLGAQFGNGSYRDMAIVSLRTLSAAEQREDALDLFYQLLREPTFPTTNLERLRGQILRSLEHDLQNPRALVNQAFFRVLYSGHPYAGDSKGTPATVQQIQQQHLQDFYRRFYVANNAVITLVGDISRSQAEQIAQQLDASLPSGSAAPKLPAPPPLNQAHFEHIDFASQQSHIVMGSLGVQRGDPRWYALVVGNEIFGGGGFSSRLNQLIRQDQGLAYSVNSSFSPMAVQGTFVMGMQTRNDQAEKAQQLLRQALQSFIAEGPSETEVEEAKQRILNRFPLSVANNQNIIDNLGSMGFYDLPLDYLDRYPHHIAAVDRAMIMQAFQELIDPDKLLSVVLQPTAKDTSAQP